MDNLLCRICLVGVIGFALLKGEDGGDEEELRCVAGDFESWGMKRCNRI